MTAVTTAFADGWTIARRNVIKLFRIPDLIIASTIQPIMFVLLFAYVFGGAIEVPGVSYREFLIGGIFVQIVAFNCAVTAIGLADDLQKGIIDRFRALPMARSAVLLGRTTSDLVGSVIVLVVMSLCGLLVGWRIHSSVGEAVAGYAVVLLFSFAMSWIAATIGLTVRSVEVAQSAGLVWLFPVTFVSNVFVPLQSMPSWLQPIAEWNPVSTVALAIRTLFGNIPDGVPPDGVRFPSQHPVAMSVVWCLLILAIFVPLAVQRYQRAAAR
jgi:ABC-2 type transport system permease protein